MIKTIPDHRGTFNILEGKNFDQIFRQEVFKLKRQTRKHR